MSTHPPTPDIDRLLTALGGGRPERVPNFEITVNRRNLRAILGREPGGESTWAITPEEALEVARAVGQDAIPCPIQYHIGQGTVSGPDDLHLLQMPDFAPRREKLETALHVVEGTGVGVCPCISGPFTAAYMAAGPIPIESFMLMIYEQPGIVNALLDFYMEYTLGVIEAVADLPFHFFYLGDDVTGFVGPDHLDELWAPRHARIVSAAKQTGKPLLCHCCGPMADVLPYFSRWGVDAVHPLQPNVNDIYAVRREYPGLALVGNMSVHDVLSFGTPEEVAADTQEHLERLAPAGGYVVCSSHSIIDSVSPANYRAMLETAWAYRT